MNVHSFTKASTKRISRLLSGFQPDFFLLWCSYEGSVGLNLTNTFLVFTEDDIGDLLKIRLTWEGEEESWNSIWKNLKKSFFGWKAKPAKPILQIRRIRVKAGETQKK